MFAQKIFKLILIHCPNKEWFVNNYIKDVIINEWVQYERIQNIVSLIKTI